MASNNKKGFAFVLVITIVAILMILGGAIITVSFAEANEVSYENKKAKAYYLALSGAKAALKAWENKQTTNEAYPDGISSTVYLEPDGSFGSVKPSNDLGNFIVNVSNIDDGKGNYTAAIKSTGNYLGVSQNVVCKETCSKVIDGESIDWYASKSGQINKKLLYGQSNGNVVVQVKKDKLKLDGNVNVDWQANTVFLECDIETPFKNTLTIKSSILVFDGTYQPNKGIIYLVPPDGTTATVYIKKDSSSYYYYNYTSSVDLGDVPENQTISSDLVPNCDNSISFSNPAWSSK